VAYVRRRLLKDGKTVVYLAMWREHAQGKELSKSFERKADAERHLVDMQHRLLTGTYAPPRLGRTPFSEVRCGIANVATGGRARTARSRSGCATRSPTSATGRSLRSARATCSRSSAGCHWLRTLCGS
jgi:hypothetical protein